jgi:hypothetical protein
MLRSAHTCCGGRKLPFDRRPNKKAVPQRRSKLKKDKLEPLRIRPDCAPEKSGNRCTVLPPSARSGRTGELAGEVRGAHGGDGINGEVLEQQQAKQKQYQETRIRKAAARMG